ncbi:uL13 family ribosomal protein, partial [Clavibacter michiganensis]|uniref:uL13 family ribosomal protein n=1 Tax=Clavibacter michiganensis TaxID=28447 RepID=UPI00292F899D
MPVAPTTRAVRPDRSERGDAAGAHRGDGNDGAGVRRAPDGAPRGSARGGQAAAPSPGGRRARDFSRPGGGSCGVAPPAAARPPRHAPALLRRTHTAASAHNMDMGNSVITVNTKRVAPTGRTREKRLAYRHSGYPGGLTATTYVEMLEKHP